MKKDNKIAKAKNKAKEKVAAKVAKAGKTATKVAGAILMCAMMWSLAGCLAPGDMEQPARSQTMTNQYRDCVIIANARSIALDTTARKLDADADTMSAPLELWTQTQANEGSETVTPTATSKPSMTIDTDAALDIPVNKANSGTSAAGGAAEKLLDAGADWLSGKLTGKKATTATTTTATTATTAPTADTSCPGGNCDKAAVTADCPDGNCVKADATADT